MTPGALASRARACLGKANAPADSASLTDANALARAGRLGEAESLYQTILAGTTHDAGVHFNRALARSAVGDWAGCLDAVNATWADCSNYTPALTLALKALKALGRDADANALRARWASAG